MLTTPDPALAGLTSAILDSPEDETLRLICADRLDETGNEQHASFIRLLGGMTWLCTQNDDAPNVVPDREYRFARPVQTGYYVGFHLAEVRRYRRRVGNQWTWRLSFSHSCRHGSEPSRATAMAAAMQAILRCDRCDCICDELIHIARALAKPPEKVMGT